jgi:hypothetical protein
MKKSNIKIIKKESSYGIMEYHYKNDKLIKKIDYTAKYPMVWTYNSKGKIKHITPLGMKNSHLDLWMGAVGLLVIFSLLYGAYKSEHPTSRTYKTPITPAGIRHSR